MAQTQAFPIVAYICYFMMLSISYFTPSESIGFSLKLIPSFSSESPLYPGNLTQSEKIQKIVEFSTSRAGYLASTWNSNSLIDPENIHLRVHGMGLFYTVEVFLGTPSKSQYLVMDTGSALTWTQCQPCINCFNQTNPIFNPNSSTSYQRLPCNHPLCRGMQCVNGVCLYSEKYGGGAITKGVGSVETFTFPYDTRVRSVPGLVFGCSNDNRYMTFSGHNISGILGINTAPISLVSQLKNIVQGRFSYCLIYFFRELEATSILKFGDDAIIRGKDVQTTPILRQNVSQHYHLNLLDISVGDRRLGFPSGTFSLRQNGTGGCMIDTGAVATLIQKDPYEIVMREFHEHFSSFGLQRVPDQTRGLEYCYKYHPKFRAYIPMTFHFQEANFKVEPTYMYYHYQERGYFCVALMSFGDKTILGAMQQQDTRFLYDLNIGALRFVPENCARDQL